MRGHQAVLQMRRAGAAPTAVWIEDMGNRTCLPRDWPWYGSSAQVEIDRNESPRTLDLRFCVRLVVFASSTDRHRLEALAANAMECGAERVLGSLFEGNTERSDMTAMTDTQGILEWHA